MPHRAIRLKYPLYKLFIPLRLLLLILRGPLLLFLPLFLIRSLIYLSYYFSLIARASIVFSFSFILTFQSPARIFSSFPPLTPLPRATSIYPPLLLHAHFSPPTAAAQSSHHSAAHKGGLRAPVSSTYDPDSAPYFFERLEKHAVTAVRVIACAQGASRLSVRRGRHVGHPWMTR